MFILFKNIAHGSNSSASLSDYVEGRRNIVLETIQEVSRHKPIVFVEEVIGQARNKLNELYLQENNLKTIPKNGVAELEQLINAHDFSLDKAKDVRRKFVACRDNKFESKDIYYLDTAAAKVTDDQINVISKYLADNLNSGIITTRADLLNAIPEKSRGLITNLLDSTNCIQQIAIDDTERNSVLVPASTSRLTVATDKRIFYEEITKVRRTMDDLFVLYFKDLSYKLGNILLKLKNEDVDYNLFRAKRIPLSVEIINGIPIRLVNDYKSLEQKEILSLLLFLTTKGGLVNHPDKEPVEVLGDYKLRMAVKMLYHIYSIANGSNNLLREIVEFPEETKFVKAVADSVLVNELERFIHFMPIPDNFYALLETMKQTKYYLGLEGSIEEKASKLTTALLHIIENLWNRTELSKNLVCVYYKNSEAKIITKGNALSVAEIIRAGSLNPEILKKLYFVYVPNLYQVKKKKNGSANLLLGDAYHILLDRSSAAVSPDSTIYYPVKSVVSVINKLLEKGSVDFMKRFNISDEKEFKAIESILAGFNF